MERRPDSWYKFQMTLILIRWKCAYWLCVRLLPILITGGFRCFSAEAPPPFLWALGAGTMYPYTDGTLNIRSAIAVDAAGNAYVTGGFRGEALFGTNVMISAGTNAAADIFVAKTDSGGHLLWVRQ